MWELPRVTVPEGKATKATLRHMLRAELGLTASVGTEYATLRHTVTHHKIQLQVFETGISEFATRDDVRFFAVDEWRVLALPAVMRRLLEKVHGR